MIMEEVEGWKAKKPPMKIEDITEIVSPSTQKLNRKVRVCKSGKNQLIRIPVEVTDLLDIKIGDYFGFDIELPVESKRDKEAILRFYIEKDGKKV